ncbi:hypothetical protein BDV06DRAFT_124952 [Aspergillus oleicola]
MGNPRAQFIGPGHLTFETSLSTVGMFASLDTWLNTSISFDVCLSEILAPALSHRSRNRVGRSASVVRRRANVTPSGARLESVLVIRQGGRCFVFFLNSGFGLGGRTASCRQRVTRNMSNPVKFEIPIFFVGSSHAFCIVTCSIAKSRELSANRRKCQTLPHQL